MARKNNIDVIVKGDYQDKDINRAINDLKKMQAAGMSVGGRMQKLGADVQQFGKSVSRVGGTLTKTVTLPIVGIGAAATKMAMDFDDSLTKMVSLVGLTRDEVDGMRSDIIAMASQYGKSANEAAEAMFFITSAGLRGSTAMDALEASLKGAAVGLGDVKTIADLATSAVNAYGFDTLSASKATDVLAAAVREGKLESSELAGAMGQVLPISSAMGVGFDEVGAAMAAMSRTGTGAAQASTQLRSIMTSILKPTAKAEKALQGMGLSSEGLRKQLREEGLLATLKTLSDSFDGNQAAAAEVFGNVRALSGVLDLMGENAQTTEEIFGNLTDTTGILDDALGEASKTTGFQLRQAFATLKNSLIEFGDVIAPFVAQFAQRIKTLGEAFQNLSPDAKRMIVMAGAIAAAVGPVLLIFGKLITMVGGVIKVFGLIAAAGSLVAIKVIAIVGVVAAVVAAFVLMWRNSEQLRETIGRLITTVQNIARVLVGDLMRAFSSIAGEGSSVRDIISRVAQVLGDILSRAVSLVIGLFTGLANGLRAVIKIFEIVFKVVQMTATVIRAALVAAIDILFNKLGPVSTALRNLANGVRNAFVTAAQSVRASFQNIGKGVEGFINFAIRAVNALIDAYNKLADVLPGVSRATHIAAFEFRSMSEGGSQAASSANNLANQIGGYASQVMRGNKATESGVSLFNNLGHAADGLAFDMDGLTDSLAGSGGGGGGGTAKASDKAAERLGKFKEKFDEVANRLKSAREEIEREYKTMAETVQNAVMGSLDFSDALPEVDEEGNRVGGTFMERLNAQAEKAVEFANRVRTLIQQGLSPDAIQMVVKEGIDAGTKIADELINGGATAIDETNRLIESTQGAAKEVGIFAADTYYATGLALARQTEDGFTKRFGPGGPGYGKLNRMMSALAKSMERTTTITVVTRHVSEGIPGRRFGGPVAAGNPYIVGEAGPELFVPTVTGRIVPNHDITGSMTGAPRAAAMGGAGTTINLTVNAGMGTQGAEVGRQIVDALKQYERRNGPVYVSA